MEQHGQYIDDFDDFGPSRSFAADMSDRDADAEEEAPRALMSREGGGSGRERRDGRDSGELMPMTRRDPVREARSLYQSSLDDMRSFLSERETPDPMHSVSSVAVTALEIAVGAGFAAFLAQRFRQAGALIPVGATLGLLGLAASQFNMVGKFSPDLRNLSLGAGASAIALWAAGRGIIANEATAVGTATAPNPPQQTPGFPPGGVGVPVTGGVPMAHQPQHLQHSPPQWPQQHAAPMGHAPYAPPQPRAFPQPMVAIAMSDFHDLVRARNGGAVPASHVAGQRWGMR